MDRRARAHLVADLLFAYGSASPEALKAVRAAADLAEPDAALARLGRLPGLDAEVLRAAEQEADRLIEESGGDAAAARRAQRGLKAAFAPSPAPAAPARPKAHVALRPVPAERYAGFTETGRGGMGVVFIALDTEMNRRVAFKLVRSDLGDQTEGQGLATPTDAVAPAPDSPASASFEELKARFLHEAWVTGGLEHPGIVPVYELGCTRGGVPYYTMRLVRGSRTLRDELRDLAGAPFEGRLALLETFLKLCDTVRYAHDKGVVHRDLKPANVALGEYGEVVLLDWGLAKLKGKDDLAASPWGERIREARAAADLETVHGLLGTPGYMSPEAAAGRVEELDFRGDVYSLGVMLFEIVTGRLPFSFDSYGALLAQLTSQDPPEAHALDPAVPTALSDLCRDAMARRPEDRPASVEILAARVRHWQTETALEREVDGLLRDARAALDAADAAEGELRLTQVDLAAAILLQVERLQPGAGAAVPHARRAAALREAGLRERERASGRRLMVRMGAVTLLVLSVAGVLVTLAIDAKRHEAETARERVLRLSDAKRVRDLILKADTLWPVHPDSVSAMSAWIDDARAVLANRPEHEAARAALRARASAQPTAAGGAWRFPSGEDDWQHQTLVELLSGLDALAAPSEAGGLWATVKARRTDAETLRKRSLETYAALWSKTVDAVASSPRYGGLHLMPVLGLVPLGRDPDSGLHEFAHLGSGVIPTREPDTQRLVPADSAAIVLVLVPGGVFFMGSQCSDPDGPNYDPDFDLDFAPVCKVTISPFFLGKHEVTIAQWKALTYGNMPSSHKPGGKYMGQAITARNPVEQVSWEEVDRVLPRHLLALPSEAQWEYACRAGTDTPWYTGYEEKALEGAANVADTTLRKRGTSAGYYTLEIDDGFAPHAPVGRFRPNPFGLHDMHGNVWEWCQDTFHRGYPDGGTPDPVVRGAGSRIFRGGSFADGAPRARSAFRNALAPDFRNKDVGVRAAMSLNRH